MRNIIIITTITLITFIAPLIPHAQSSVPLEGQVLNFNSPEEIEIGLKLVPMRAIFEAFGANVAWDKNTGTITATLPGTKISLSTKGMFYKNGRVEALDTPPQLVNGRTLVPLKFVTDALGHRITWHGTVQQASITDKTRNFTVKVTFIELGQSTALCIDTINNYEIFYYPAAGLKINNAGAEA